MEVAAQITNPMHRQHNVIQAAVSASNSTASPSSPSNASEPNAAQQPREEIDHETSAEAPRGGVSQCQKIIGCLKPRCLQTYKIGDLEVLP